MRVGRVFVTVGFLIALLFATASTASAAQPGPGSGGGTGGTGGTGGPPAGGGGCGSGGPAAGGPGGTGCIRPRNFPSTPYAYDVCRGPNADGTVSETQVDTCQVYLTGGGGSFFAGDHLTIARRSPTDIATVVSCAGSNVTTATMATITANLCDFTFTSQAAGSGLFVGTIDFLIPSTVEPNTPVGGGQVAFYCSVIQAGLQRYCPDVAVPIDVRGPGATVIDEIPPTFTFMPPDMTVDATGPTDTVVTYPSPTAADNAPGNVTVACTPASGSQFAVGPTVVTCTATDASGNVATATFTVTAQNTPESLCRVTQLDVDKDGLAHSMCQKLDHGDFNAYMNEVEAQSGKSLTDQQAQDLEGLAQLLMV